MACRAKNTLILIVVSACWIRGQCVSTPSIMAVPTTSPYTTMLQTSADIVQVPLGLESGAIPDSSFTASSKYSLQHAPRKGRLYIVQSGALRGGWVAETADINQWIQVDLLTPYFVTGVATQGRQDYSQWVTSFKIACSMDNVTFDTAKDPVNSSADKIFPGNSDRNTVVFNLLPDKILCRYVRLLPVTWDTFISLRMELYREGTVEHVIQDAPALGLESGAIPNSSLNASSQYDPNHSPQRGRLNMVRVGNLRGAWCAGSGHLDLNQWIQVDLLGTYNIIGVATQGRQDYDQWVTSFKMNCSMDGLTFDTVQDPSNPGTSKIFPGNSDQDTIVYNRLPVPLLCRYVRILPYTWHGWISLRMELYGTLEEMEIIVCEYEEANIDCGANLIHISAAVYGRTDSTTCPQPSVSMVSDTSCELDVVAVLGNNCDGLTQCRITASNSLAGDPCAGTVKYLNVSINCKVSTLSSTTLSETTLTSTEGPSMASSLTSTETPSATSSLTSTEAPSMTSSLTPTEALSATSSLTSTEALSMTSSPTSMEALIVTSSPTSTEAPSVTSSPTSMEALSVTSSPTSTEAPSVTSSLTAQSNHGTTIPSTSHAALLTALKTPIHPQTQMTSDETPTDMSTSSTVALNISTSSNKTTSPPLKGLLRVIASMNDGETVSFSFSMALLLYFISLCMALMLRCISSRRLHRKEVEPDTVRPRRMYEIVNFWAP